MSTTPDFASLKSEAPMGQKSGYEVGVDRGGMGVCSPKPIYNWDIRYVSF